MIKDEQGIERHRMTWHQLSDLYDLLCVFLADCTREEVQECRDHIVGIKTLIHQRMNSNQRILGDKNER